MNARLTNRSSSLKIVPLNSGRTVILAPGEVSGPIPEAEISGSERIGKLVRRGELAIVREQSSPSCDATGDRA
jgi:hypothetical protein